MSGLAVLGQRRLEATSVPWQCKHHSIRKRRLQATSYPEASLLLELLSPTSSLVVSDTPLGRGLVSPAGSAKGTVLLEIDWCNVITVTDDPDKTGNAYGQQALEDWQLLHGELPPLLKSFVLSGSSWFLRLMAWLLYLKAHGTGLWPLYISLLPTEVDMCCLLNYTPEERAELQDGALQALADRDRSSILSIHDTVFSSTSGSLKELQLAAAPEDTLWAAAMVNSRCFSDMVGREAVSLMVPGADMANHNTTPNAAYQLDVTTNTFTLRAKQAVAAGEEVCISYLGTQPNKSNVDMMKNYGFILPQNPSDRITFTAGKHVQDMLYQGPLFSHIQAAAEKISAQSAHTRPQDAAAAWGFAGEPGSASSTLGGRETACLESLRDFAGGQGYMAAGSAGDAAAILRAVAVLQEECEAQLQGAATSMSDDEALLLPEAAAALPVRVRAAVEYRLERKRLLSTMVDILVQCHADLSGSTSYAVITS